MYDIFISYRRKETADKAEHLFTLLEHGGGITARLALTEKILMVDLILRF